jgi:hypothetical protein
MDSTSEKSDALAAAAALVAPVRAASRVAVDTAAPDEPTSSAPPVEARAPEVREQAPQIARARAIAVTKTAPSRRMQAGDSICGNCGEGNPPARKFCSRCGDSLVEAVHYKAPWWHRFRPRRGPKVVALGAEAGRTAAGAHGHGFKHVLGEVYRKGRLVVAVGIVAAGAVCAAYPPARTAVTSLFSSEKAKVTGAIDVKYQPIRPLTVTASAYVPRYPARFVSDLNLNTYWLAPWSPSAEVTLTMTFSHPVTLREIILHNGNYSNYTADGRPSSLLLVFSNQESYTITPVDTPQSETYPIEHAVLIKSVTFQVTAINQGTGSDGSDVAISEIELFGIG